MKIYLTKSNYIKVETSLTVRDLLESIYKKIPELADHAVANLNYKGSPWRDQDELREFNAAVSRAITEKFITDEDAVFKKIMKQHMDTHLDNYTEAQFLLEMKRVFPYQPVFFWFSPYELEAYSKSCGTTGPYTGLDAILLTIKYQYQKRFLEIPSITHCYRCDYDKIKPAAKDAREAEELLRNQLVWNVYDKFFHHINYMSNLCIALPEMNDCRQRFRDPSDFSTYINASPEFVAMVEDRVAKWKSVDFSASMYKLKYPGVSFGPSFRNYINTPYDVCTVPLT